MDPLPNINYIHVQAQTNVIIIVIYLINVLYGPLINELWDSGTKHLPTSF